MIGNNNHKTKARTSPPAHESASLHSLAILHTDTNQDIGCSAFIQAAEAMKGEQLRFSYHTSASMPGGDCGGTAST